MLRTVLTFLAAGPPRPPRPPFSRLFSATPPHAARDLPGLVAQHLPRPDATLLVSVSGGADSTALLHALADASAAAGAHRLEVVHFNHGLRGAGSDGDEAFVRALAAARGVPCHVVRWHRDAAGPGMQARARAWRRAESEALLAARGGGAVALGHHADDQLETRLLRLLRGAALSSLGGMRAAGPGPYVRPLLTARKAEVVGWLRATGRPWREDPSNAESDYTRNRVRNEIVPLLADVAGEGGGACGLNSSGGQLRRPLAPPRGAAPRSPPPSLSLQTARP